MPMLKSDKLFSIARSLIKEKYLIGETLIGGKHIKPIIPNFNSFLQKIKKFLKSLKKIPDLCLSSATLTWIKYFNFLLFFFF